MTRLRRYRHVGAEFSVAVRAADIANIAIVKQEDDSLMLMAVSSRALDRYISEYHTALPAEAVKTEFIPATTPLHLSASCLVLRTQRKEHAKAKATQLGGVFQREDDMSITFKFQNLPQVNRFIAAFLDNA